MYGIVPVRFIRNIVKLILHQNFGYENLYWSHSGRNFHKHAAFMYAIAQLTMNSMLHYNNTHPSVVIQRDTISGGV